MIRRATGPARPEGPARRPNRSGSSDGEDELALEVAPLERSVRIDDALEGERLLHVDAEFTLLDELDQTAQADRIGVGHDAAEAQAGCLIAGGELRIVIGYCCQR